jgi:hypothetical protein
MRGKWHAPLDPSCPKVKDFTEGLFNDPMSRYAPLDEIMDAWEAKHRGKCTRCQEYGAENIDVVYN